MSENEKKHCIAIFAHDGINSHHCGVGTVIQAHLQLLPSVMHEVYPIKQYAMYAVTPYQTPKSPAYSEEIKHLSMSICQSQGGDLIEVSNGSDGSVSWGNKDNWKTCSVNGAIVANQLIEKHESCIFMFHDDPFAGAASIVHSYNISNRSVKSIWIPHSTSLLNDYPKPRTDRLSWEYECATRIKENSDIQIGYTCEFMKQHLIQSFHIPKSSLTPARIGVNLNEMHRENTQKKVYNIRRFLNSGSFIFSYGRAHPTKGFHQLIEAFLKVSDVLGMNLIILAPSDQELSNYSKLIKRKTANHENRILIITNFNNRLPHDVIAHDNCSIVAAVSKSEPCGLVPMETRRGQHKSGPIMIVSNSGGLAEQVKDQIDGFLVEPDNIDAMAALFIKISKLSTEKRISICAEASQTLKTKYDAAQNLRETVSLLIGEY